MDGMIKSAYFLVIKMIDIIEEYDRLHIQEIIRIHGVPLSTILDRETQFTTQF